MTPRPSEPARLIPGHGPGMWAADPTTTPRVVTIRCPRCGEPQRLNKHQVAPDGAVTPMVLCRRCPWANDVHLVDWRE